MKDGKSRINSKTFWGLLVVVVVAVAKFFGLDIDLAFLGDGVQTGDVDDLIQVLAAVWAWWGVRTSREPIKGSG